MNRAQVWNTLADRILLCGTSAESESVRAVAYVALQCRMRAQRVRRIKAHAGASGSTQAQYARTRQSVRDLAVRIMVRADEINQAFTVLVRAAEATYGDHGPLVSGAVREHFPEPVKVRLRRLAYARGTALAFSRTLWDATGATGARWHALRSAVRA